MKEISIINSATPDPNEVLVSYLDEDGFPRNVLLRAEQTSKIDFGSEEAIAIKALECYVGEEDVKEGRKEIPPFNIKKNDNRDLKDKAQLDSEVDLNVKSD